MPPVDRSEVAAALAAWLRNDRRLGIRHWAVPPPDASAAPSAGVVQPRGAGVRRPPDRHPPIASADSAAPGVRSSARPPAAAPPRITEGLFGDDPAAGSAAPGRALPVSARENDLPPLCDRDLAPADAQRELDLLNESYVRGCVQCVLHRERTQTVFGQGHPRPALVFVGEGPGEEEDAQGLAFVGRAGQLLTRMIAAMTLTRDQVYICNVVKCRPPANRTPTDDEMAACSPYLFRQLAILRPRVIVALGRPAAQTLLATREPIGKLRGRFFDFPPPDLRRPELPPMKLMPTFHPAYLLRSPNEKPKAWADLKLVMQELGIAIPAGC